MGIAQQFGRILFSIGAHVSESTVLKADNALNYLAAGCWSRTRGQTVVPTFKSRIQLFEQIADDLGNQQTLYLEFGVFRGDSMRAWSKLLTNPLSQLHGFDSFEGLPEEWTSETPRGHFSLGGQLPNFDDKRVKLFKGWFEDVLPSYEPPTHDRLVVSLDADLYSATKYVLNHIQALIVPGTYLYFDEFRHRNHEMKAFSEFERNTGMQFTLVGQSRSMEHVAFRRDG